MPHNLTEATTYDANVQVPDTGDARTAASVTTFAQSLANRTKYLKSHVDALEALNLGTRVTALENARINGLLLGSNAASSSNGTQIVVGDIHALIIGGAQFGEQSAVTVTPALLSVSAWHYLYAYNNDGVIAYESSLTGPGADLVFQFGDSSRRFICSFYVNASNTIRPFRKVDRAYRYRGTSTTEALSIGPIATGDTVITATAFMPPLARIARIIVGVNNDHLDQSSVLRVFSGADSDTTNAQQVNGNNIASVNEYLSLEVETNSSRQFGVTVAGNTSGGAVIVGTVKFDGYLE